MATGLGYGGQFVGGQYVMPGKQLREPVALQRQKFDTQAILLGAEQNLARVGAERGNWELQRDKELWQMQKQKAQANKNLAGDFLSAWTSEVADFKKMFTGEMQAGQGGILGELKGISDQIGKEYESFKTTYQPYIEEFIGAGRDEARARREIAGSLKDQAIPDYAGVEGRARADVAGQSAIARREAQREMMGMGINPNAGKFGALTRKSYLDEAKATAISMNLARRGEKERAGDFGLKTMSLLDPAKTASVGMNLQSMGQGMLSQKANVAGQFANVADTYGKNVINPMGTLAGYQLAQNTAGLPTQFQNMAIPYQREQAAA
jgi:hypothetical protein